MTNWMVKVKEEKDYVQVPNETALAVEMHCENPISLQALGMIVNMWSYNIEKWELHKTQLQTRYALNKRTSVDSAFDELINANYILMFKARNEKGQFECIYLYRIRPFSEVEIEVWKEQVKEKYGENFIFVNEKNVENKGIEANVENQQRVENEPMLEINSGKSTEENVHLLKTKEKKNIINKDLTTKTTKELKELVISSSSPEVNKIDLIFKSLYKNAPLEEIKKKLFEDAKNRKVKMKTEEQYLALYAKRIQFYLDAQENTPQTPETGQISDDTTEIGEIPIEERSRQFKAFLSESEDVDHSEPTSELDSPVSEVDSEPNSEVATESKPSSETLETYLSPAERQQKIVENLALTQDPKKTPEEIAEAKKEIRRLMDQIRDEKR
jgi:hypothetical protein